MLNSWFPHVKELIVTCQAADCHVSSSWLWRVKQLIATFQAANCHVSSSWLPRVRQLIVTCQAAVCHVSGSWLPRVRLLIAKCQAADCQQSSVLQNPEVSCDHLMILFLFSPQSINPFSVFFYINLLYLQTTLIMSQIVLKESFKFSWKIFSLICCIFNGCFKSVLKNWNDCTRFINFNCRRTSCKLYGEYIRFYTYRKGNFLCTTISISRNSVADPKPMKLDSELTFHFI